MNQDLTLLETIRKLYSALEDRGFSKNKPDFIISKDDFLSEVEERGDAPLSEVYLAIKKDFEFFRKEIQARSDMAVSEYRKRYLFSRTKVYPPIDIHKIVQNHTVLLTQLGRFAAHTLANPRDINSWKTLLDNMETIGNLEKSFFALCWQGIEQHDKYKYDVWRYRYASWGFILAIIVFLIVNIPSAYRNIESIIPFVIQKSHNNPNMTSQPISNPKE